MYTATVVHRDGGDELSGLRSPSHSGLPVLQLLRKGGSEHVIPAPFLILRRGATLFIPNAGRAARNCNAPS